MPTAETLRALIALVEEAPEGMDLNFEADLLRAVFGHDMSKWPADFVRMTFNPTFSVDAAREVARRALPDFWMSSGLCSLTGHASIGPDYNGPAGERLRGEWPEADFHSGFHADLAPGDGPHRECYAILSCMLQAMLARALLQQSEPSHASR
ncbi:hypothetical protein [Methylobacterium sp. WL19]|uniref:hypothetical protein n=1 Tax=Methylobacterium sp. WL19 TaxID=2603896 RepID=UPI0011CCDE7C|nr:hypothetical protein [Methylobacterium sp. WL19]TXN33943.1 hypothetical protein FV220_00400 [Methylobacterium sp. WL19]